MFLPSTHVGTVAVYLAAGHVLLMFAWRLMGPLGAFPGLVAGLVAGIVALVAILRRHDRGILVFAAAAPLLLVVAFVALELLVGHN